MLRRSQNPAIRLLAAVLILGTASSAPAMALMAARGGMAGMAEHGHQQQGHHPSNGDTRDCCDLCWTAGCCFTAPEPPLLPSLPAPAITIVEVRQSTDSGRLTALPLLHRLPFAQGPPAPLM